MRLLETYVFIQVRDQNLESGLKIARKRARDATQEMQRMLDSLSFRGIIRQATSLQGILLTLGAGYGLQRLSKDFVDVGSNMERMRITLDTLTKGQGEAWFQKLNEWALRMPISTQEAVQAFVRMRAMGMKPTIDQMTIILDAVSALGGRADTLEGLTLALGQIYSKTKLEGYELRQLAERGIPAVEILAEKLGISSAELLNAQRKTIGAKEALDALFSGMAERYGGQTQRIMKTFSGLAEMVRSYFVEFQRITMESGALDVLKVKMEQIVNWAEEMRKSGQLKEWGENLSRSLGLRFSRSNFKMFLLTSLMFW